MIRPAQPINAKIAYNKKLTYCAALREIVKRQGKRNVATPRATVF